MVTDRSQYPDVDVLDAEHEALLRALVDADRKRDPCKQKSLCLAYDRDSAEGTLVRHLDQAKMLNVVYYGGDPMVMEVYAAGYSYVEKRDREIESEERRRQERREDKAHDWKISVFTALVGVLAALGGTFFGYWLGAASPFQ